MEKSNRTRLILTFASVFLLILAVILLGVLLFRDAKYNVISLAVALLSCLPFFLRFEKRKQSAGELVTIAVMTALSAVGRLIFAPLPFFKPMTAVTIITGIAFGPEAGFMTGSLGAIVSNLYFGQGPWTPFQMLLWGLIGFLAGALFRRGKKPGIVWLVISGVVSGILFSIGMDIWTTFSMDGSFSFARYLFYIASALPVTAIYAVSNVIFLLALTGTILKKTERIRRKYGLFPE